MHFGEKANPMGLSLQLTPTGSSWGQWEMVTFKGRTPTPLA